MKDATDKAIERAEELGVDLEEVEGTGQDGRVTVPDVEAFTKEEGPQEEAPPEPPSEPVAVVLNPATNLGAYDFGEDVFAVEPKSSIQAGETRMLASEGYERHSKTKVGVGGFERRVIVKA